MYIYKKNICHTFIKKSHKKEAGFRMATSILKYSKTETEKYTRKLERTPKNSLAKEIERYAKSPDVNMRIAAAHYILAQDILINDKDYRVLRTMADTIIRNDLEAAHKLLNHPQIEVRSCAAIALAQKDELTYKELSRLDIPIIRSLISKRLCLSDIAEIYKHGDIKTLLNDELNVMSRRDHIEVKEIRDKLNAHPFRQGIGSFEVIDELDEDFYPSSKASVEETQPKQTPEDIIEDVFEESISDEPQEESSEEPVDELLSSILG